MKPEGGLWVANLEIASDHAMIPFGAGERKCVGDQFALLEARGGLGRHAAALLRV